MVNSTLENETSIQFKAANNEMKSRRSLRQKNAVEIPFKNIDSHSNSSNKKTTKSVIIIITYRYNIFGFPFWELYH